MAKALISSLGSCPKSIISSVSADGAMSAGPAQRTAGRSARPPSEGATRRARSCIARIHRHPFEPPSAGTWTRSRALLADEGHVTAVAASVVGLDRLGDEHSGAEHERHDGGDADQTRRP